MFHDGVRYDFNVEKFAWLRTNRKRKLHGASIQDFSYCMSVLKFELRIQLKLNWIICK